VATVSGKPASRSREQYACITCYVGRAIRRPLLPRSVLCGASFDRPCFPYGRLTVVKLDRYDIAILRVLARDGRITKSKLAEEVNLSISPTWERVRKLEESGVIKGYRAELDWVGSLNASRIVVEVTLARHTERDMRRFEEVMQAAPEVVQCYATGGGVDYVLHVVSRDIYHYQRFIDSLLIEEIGIERYFTYIVTKVVKSMPDSVPDWE
jgi:Lrp/AsnC family transcriptional regulator of ectoine degradation